jgi:dihydroorotase
MLDLLIKNGSCYIDNDLKVQDIAIKDNKIIKIGNIDSESKEVIEANELIVLPGCIDTQTHFREPGSTDTEDLHSGSRAAIVGGITSVFEMPNTNPPTSNKIEFQKKLDLANNRMYCNYAFYFGATPNNASELADLKDLEGCCGIKLFAGSSTGNLLVEHEEDIEKIFKSSSKVVAVHSEDEAMLNMRKKLIKKGDVHTHAIWRNEECAISSTRRIVRIAERYKKRHTFFMLQQNKKLIFYHSIKVKLHLKLHPSI